jgi:hypothetical protein
MDQSNNRYLSRQWMIGGRLIAGVVFFLVGLFKNLSPKDAIYLTGGILTFCVIFEEVFCDGFIKTKPNQEKLEALKSLDAVKNQPVISHGSCLSMSSKGSLSA